MEYFILFPTCFDERVAYEDSSGCGNGVANSEGERAVKDASFDEVGGDRAGEAVSK